MHSSGLPFFTRLIKNGLVLPVSRTSIIILFLWSYSPISPNYFVQSCKIRLKSSKFICRKCALISLLYKVSLGILYIRLNKKIEKERELL